MNNLLNGLKESTNLTYTVNGAVAYKSTLSKVYDLFCMGAAMRSSSEVEIIKLFSDAYLENPTLALKCLFYLRDCHGSGQGERRFFRVVIKWLATNATKEMKNLIQYVPEYGRFDDWYSLVDTPCEKPMFAAMNKQFIEDMSGKTITLLGKWAASENCSSKEMRELGRKTREALELTPREYRKMLSFLRKKINIVESLMSQNRWNEIDFSKLPSRAGFLYRNTFIKREETKERYEKFMTNSSTKVNAKTLYPYDVVHSVQQLWDRSWYGERYTLSFPVDSIERKTINKYWSNLNNYFNEKSLNALIVADTSGSMISAYNKSNIAPIDVAISLALYAAEHMNGPFKNHFISFSSRPQLIETVGVDFCDKVVRINNQNLCENTNIEATFDLILNTAIENHLSQKDMPEHLIIITDMNFDASQAYNHRPLMENIERKWRQVGYKMPKLVWWNVNASLSDGNIPMKDKDGVTFVSGASPVIFDAIMTGKTGQTMMMDILNSERYQAIQSIME